MRAAPSTRLALALVAALAAPRALARPYHADAPASTLLVRATKGGFLSVFAHNHQLAPARWQASVDVDPDGRGGLRVDVVVDAATLHEREPRLSTSARAVVDRETAGPEVLDADQYPEIRFQGSASAVVPEGPGDFAGVLHGTLSLHGSSRPLAVAFRARSEGRGYHASGAVRFRQTAFGMKPYSTAMGSIGVDDELLVEFNLVLVPGAPGSWAARAP